MPDKLLVLFSSLCQTVKLFSNPDSEQQIIWACIWPIDVNNICIYEQPHAPLHFSMINLNVIFHPLSGSALQIVLVVIQLFLLRDENLRIWAEAELSGLLSSELGLTVPAWWRHEYTHSRLHQKCQTYSDTFALIMLTTAIDFLSLILYIDFLVVKTSNCHYSQERKTPQCLMLRHETYHFASLCFSFCPHMQNVSVYLPGH